MSCNYINETCQRKSDDDFIKRIVEILGPVLLGIKPCELLSFPTHDINVQTKIIEIEKFFSVCKKIDLIKFNYNSKSIKIFFYNKVALNKTLNDNRNLKVLKNMGYPYEYKLDTYLNIIVRKMMNGNIPDEIGIFLGYPLKDVLGFIGNTKLKLTKVNGWRVYGDPRISDLKFNEFTKAKYKIKDMLKYLAPNKILQTA